MRRLCFCALAAIVLPISAHAATVTTNKTCGPTDEQITTAPNDPVIGILAITTCEATTTTEAITEVVLAGVGPDRTFAYPSLTDAPGPTETGTAINDALSFFGVAAGQPITSTSLNLFDSVVGPVTQSRAVFFSSDAVAVGDINGDPRQLIVIVGRVDLEFTDAFDVTNRYRLSVDLQTSGPGPNPPSPTPVPLPATAPLLLIGLAGLRTIRRFARTERGKKA